jgi:hypothetical protein
MQSVITFFYPQRIGPILAGYGLVRTMEINARVISGLDPGAIPGGSTTFSLRVIGGDFEGPISIDRRLKALLSLGVAHRFGPFSKCER